MSLTASRISAADVVRNLDLLVLLLALPAFIAIDAPMAGYVVTAAAWLIGRGGKVIADRRRSQALQASDRNTALGLTAAAMLGRLWLLAGAILLVGLLVERDAGLAGAVLAAALVTSYLAGEGLAHLLEGEGAS